MNMKIRHFGLVFAEPHEKKCGVNPGIYCDNRELGSDKY